MKKLLVALSIALALALGGALLLLSSKSTTARLIGRNFGESIPGVYRMGQSPPFVLRWLEDMYGFKTVIHLAWSGSKEDLAEQELFEELGVDYHPFTWKPEGAPTDEELEDMLVLIRRSPKPVLIHCIGGIDRTGGLAGILELESGRSLAEVQQSWPRHHAPSWGWQDAVKKWAAAQAAKSNDR